MISAFLSQFLEDIPQGNEQGICAVCGVAGDKHLGINQVLDAATGKITELLRHNTQSICGNCAALWGKPKVFHRSIFVTPNRLAFPLIAPEGTIKKDAPKKERCKLQDWPDRPTWRELIRDKSWWQQERYSILTTDSQRRIWNRARASKGENLALLFHDLTRGISEMTTLYLPKVVECLDVVELVYSNGFSKASIEESLFLNQNLVLAAKYEQLLRPLRGSDEFRFAVVVAQKNESLIELPPTPAPSPPPTKEKSPAKSKSKAPKQEPTQLSLF